MQQRKQYASTLKNKDSTINMTLTSHSPRAYGFYAALYKEISKRF